MYNIYSRACLLNYVFGSLATNVNSGVLKENCIIQSFYSEKIQRNNKLAITNNGNANFRR
jgi:hypothetical protein